MIVNAIKDFLIEDFKPSEIKEILITGGICLILYLPGKKAFNKVADIFRKHKGL